jgi:hypothetical protein
VLLFFDSATARRFTATLVADTLTVVDRGTTYRFRIVPPPSLYGSLWAEASCRSVTGEDFGCPVTDDSGVVSTIIGGGLQFDFNVPDNHYAWQTLYQRRRLSGATDTVQVTTTGTYSWDGTMLSMKDEASGAVMTGHLAGGPFHLLVQSGASVIEFYRVVLPHSS